ncbi:tetratricopeptide repeat protein [Candidatus Sumerlaeota bacterium]|nr:tetratricopeptide repeat protein [Candidatus Sumerlaeota bacterium]
MNDRPDNSRRRFLSTRPILAAILFVAVALRIAYLAEIVDEPDFKAPSLDALYHDYWARALISGDWTPPLGVDDPLIRSTPYFRPPGYPWFLAAVYRLVGGSYLSARLVQMGVGVLNCFLGFLLGRRLFGTTVGLLSAALMAVYWAFIYFEAEFLSPVLEVFFCLISTLTLLSWRRSNLDPSRAAAAGGILGLFALVRPNVLLWAGAVGVWMVWVALGREVWRRFFVSAAALLVTMVAVIAPITLRNYRVSRDRVLISSNFGVNLYANYNPDARPAYWPLRGLTDLAGITVWDCFSYPKIVRALERREGLPGGSMTYSRASSLLSRDAWRYILDHPARSASLALQRFLLFWGPAEVTNNKVVAIERSRSVVLRSTLLRFPAVLALAILGAGILVRRVLLRRGDAACISREEDELRLNQRDGSILIGLLTAAYVASLFAAPVGARFRVALVPFLIVFAALALESFGRTIRRRRLGRLLVLGVALVALHVAVSRRYVDYRPSEAAWHSMRGNAFRAIGKPNKAIESYSRAVELDGSLLDARNNLAALLAQSGRPDEAIRQYEAILRDRPRTTAAHVNLAVALGTTGRFDEAMRHYRTALEVDPDNASAWYNMAVLLSHAGRDEESLEAYKEAIRLGPDFPDAHENMGVLFATTGRLDEAIRCFSRAAEVAPKRAQPHLNLAEAHWEKGEKRVAEEEFRKCLELDPDHAIGYLRLGEFLMTTSGRSDEARRCLERSLALASEQGAQDVAARARECLDTMAAAR